MMEYQETYFEIWTLVSFFTLFPRTQGGILSSKPFVSMFCCVYSHLPNGQNPFCNFTTLPSSVTFQIFTTFAPNLDKTFCSLDCVPCTSASCKVGCSAENCFWGRGSWQRHMVVLLVKRWQRAMSDTMGVCRALQLKHKTVDTSPPLAPSPVPCGSKLLGRKNLDFWGKWLCA